MPGSNLTSSTFSGSTTPANNLSNIAGNASNLWGTADWSSINPYLGIASGVISAISGGINASQIKDASSLEDYYTDSTKGMYSEIGNSLEDVLNQHKNFYLDEAPSTKELLNYNAGQQVSNALSTGFSTGLSTGMAAGPLGGAIGAGVGLLASGIGAIRANKKAYNESRKLRNLRADAYDTESSLFQDNLQSTYRDIQNQARGNIVAYGGPLTMRYTGTMSPFGNTFANGGGIHIKKANRGKFTKYCGGKVTSECIAKGKRSSDPAVRKRATFAASARKWKHAFGGDLLTHGAEWDNGITIIGNGGTHEENPMEGVQMGMDAQGIPNLVEEGEVIFNDYVFSDRINVPNSMRSSLGLSKGKNLTFAKAAKKLSKEAEERPNDPISKRGLLDSMSKLQQAQEFLRQQGQEGNSGVQYAHGGRMGTLFDGLGEQPQFLNPYYRFMSTYGQSPFTGDIKYTDTPDDNELLDVARMYNNEAPLGTGTSIVANNSKKKSNSLTNLRYAPVIGAAIGLGQNIFSKPDYSSSDAILDAANEAGIYTPVEFNPIGDYLTYRPFDINYIANQIRQQGNTQLKNINNLSGGNRAAAMTQQALANYNTQIALGNAYRQAEESNLAQKEKVATFNRGTNQYNTEMELKAAMANQEAALKAKSQRLSGVAQAMTVRDAVDARRGASMSASLTNLFNSLGDIGREEVMKSWINENPALYYAISTEGAGTPYKGKKEDKKSRGGYLTIKKK